MIKQTGLYLIARITSAAASLFTVGLTTHLLKPDELGQCNLAFAAAGLGNVMLFTWMGFVLWRYYPRCAAEGSARALVIWMLKAALVVLLAWLVYWALVRMALPGVRLSIIGLMLPLGLLLGAGEQVQALLQIQGRVQHSVTLTMVQAVALILVSACVLLGGWRSGEGYLLANIGVLAACLAWSVFLCRLPRSESSGLANLPAREMLLFGLPQTFTSICALLLGIGDRFLIEIFQGASAVAIYHTAYNLGDLAVQIPVTAVTQAAVPMIISSHEKGRGESAALLQQAMRMLFRIVLPVTCLAMALGPLLGRILLGSNYHQALFYLPAICLGSWLYGITKILNMPLQLEKRPWTLVGLLAVGALINLLLNVALLPSLALKGAVIATVASFIAYLALSWIVVRPLLPPGGISLLPARFLEWVALGFAAAYGSLSCFYGESLPQNFILIAGVAGVALGLAILLSELGAFAAHRQQA